MATTYKLCSLVPQTITKLGAGNIAFGRKPSLKLIGVYRQEPVASRSFSALPNIVRKKAKQQFCVEGEWSGNKSCVPISLAALAFIRQASTGIGSTTATTESQSTSDGEKKQEKKDKWYSGKNAWKLGLVSLTGMGILMSGNLLFIWGAPMKDKDGEEIPDEFSTLPTWEAYPKRAIKEMHFFKKMIQEPSSQTLLPDPVKEPYYQPPYTLVLEMTGVLVHPDWTLSTGWRFKKRPAVDYFFQQVAPPLFEVVIYTHEQGFTAFPIIDGLDQHQSVMFRLFRDATRYQNGTHMKDLACLNRDLSKVIIIDCDPKAVSLQPRNALNLKKWIGNDDDRTLVDLAAFLRTIASSGVEDIRSVLDHYNQFDDPLEAFKLNQIRLQEEQEKTAKMKADEQRNKSLTSSFSFGLGGRKG